MNDLLENTNIESGAMLIRFAAYYHKSGITSHPSWHAIVAKYMKYVNDRSIDELDVELTSQYKYFHEQKYRDWANENGIILWSETSIDRILITISHNIRAVDDTLFWIDNEIDAIAFKLTWL